MFFNNAVRQDLCLHVLFKALNALANHGFINRNGKALTIPDLVAGLSAGMNVGADFTTAIGAAGLLSSPMPLLGSFNLNDLNQHNFPIEVSFETHLQTTAKLADLLANSTTHHCLVKTPISATPIPSTNQTST